MSIPPRLFHECRVRVASVESEDDQNLEEIARFIRYRVDVGSCVMLPRSM